MEWGEEGTLRAGGMDTQWLLAAAVAAGVGVVSLACVVRGKAGVRRRRGAGPRDDKLWADIVDSCTVTAAQEPGLRTFVRRAVLSHGSLEGSLTHVLAHKFATGTEAISARSWSLTFGHVLLREKSAQESGQSLSNLLRADLQAVVDRDPACIDAAHALLSFKGFLGLQAHRVAHVLWHENRKAMACAIQARASELFAVDIHPAATIGSGVMIDHATGVVIGETAVVGDECTFLHGVTLGGTGKENGDRHPKLGNCVLVGAHASILGNVRIGDRAKIGCGSVVLSAIPSGATAVGLPAKVIGRSKEAKPALESDNALRQVSFRGSATNFRTIWKDLDVRCDGYLTPLQFHERLRGRGMSSGELDELFFQLDQDNDGIVSETDFKRKFHHFVRNISRDMLADLAPQGDELARLPGVSETPIAPDWNAINASTWHAGVGNMPAFPRSNEQTNPLPSIPSSPGSLVSRPLSPLDSGATKGGTVHNPSSAHVLQDGEDAAGFIIGEPEAGDPRSRPLQHMVRRGLAHSGAKNPWEATLSSSLSIAAGRPSPRKAGSLMSNSRSLAQLQELFDENLPAVTVGPDGSGGRKS